MTVQISPDDKNVFKPEGSMPENVAYIWPDRALVYYMERPSLPDPDQDNLWIPHRQIVMLRNAGFMVKELAATVPDPPKTDSGRAAIDSLQGRFSERDQNYRVVLGVFSAVRRVQGSDKDIKVYDILKFKSIGQLFHVSITPDVFDAMLTGLEKGIVGTIDFVRFKWSPPSDPTHNKPESNTSVEYDLPPPEDIPAFDREKIDKLRKARDMEPLPSFAKFLQVCGMTRGYYFPATTSLNRNGQFSSEKKFLEAVEKERMTRWGVIKGWSDEEVDSATKELAKNKEKYKRQAVRSQKRNSSVSCSQPEDAVASPTKKPRGRRESRGGRDSPGSDVSTAPRTPSQRQRRQSSGGGMQTPDMNHSSPLSQVWTSPLANIYDQEIVSPGQGQGSPSAAEDPVLEQWIQDHSSPVTPDHPDTGTGYFHSPSRISTPTSGQHSIVTGSPGHFARPGASNNSFSTVHNSPSGMTGRNGYHSMSPPAPPRLNPPGFDHSMSPAPPRFNPLGFDHTGATGFQVATPMDFNRQHMSTHVQPSPRPGSNFVAGGGSPHGTTNRNGYRVMGPIVPLGSNPDLRSGLVTHEALLAAMRNSQQGISTPVQAPHQTSFYAQGVQASGNSTSFAIDGGFAPQIGYVPNHGGNNQSTRAYQNGGSNGGSNNVMMPNQHNLSAQNPMVGNTPFLQEGPLSYDHDTATEPDPFAEFDELFNNNQQYDDEA